MSVLRFQLLWFLPKEGLESCRLVAYHVPGSRADAPHCQHSACTHGRLPRVEVQRFRRRQGDQVLLLQYAAVGIGYRGWD